jgi:CRISPR/Cas system CSM-associated protein Csm4 (group 5 of RAMP superfamily)
MYEDPIVEELRTIRREHVKRFNYAPQAIFEDLKKQEAESGRMFVQRDIKKVSKSGNVEAA